MQLTLGHILCHREKYHADFLSLDEVTQTEKHQYEASVVKWITPLKEVKCCPMIILFLPDSQLNDINIIA